MTYIIGKQLSALYAMSALAVGLILISHGLSAQTVLRLTDLSLTHAWGIGAAGVFQILLGICALTAAAVSYRLSSQQF